MNNVKIALIYPYYIKVLRQTKFQGFDLRVGAGKIPERPHIGLAFLSEALSQNGYDHLFIDMNFVSSYRALKTQLKSFKPDVIGLTMVTPRYLEIYRLIKKIKRGFPQSKIIVGGPHVAVTKEQLLRDCPEIDVGFISESEQSLIAYLDESCNPENINGVIFKKNGRIFLNPPKLEENIDIFGFPKYEKFDLSRYLGIGLYTSRGCPFRCVFCTVESFRRNSFRARSVKSMIEEIKYWYNRGQRLLAIEDDNFTFNQERVYDLCSKIIKLDYKDLTFSLGQGIRADRVSKRLLKKMYEAGFKYITVPVEGGNNKILKSLNKNEKIERIERTIKNACDIGYEVRLLFVIGAKDETVKDVEDSFKIAKKYPIMYSRFNHLLPIPGTPLFDWVKREKLLLSPPEKYLNKDCLDYTVPYYETPEFTKEERKQVYNQAEQLNRFLFYRYLARKLKMLGPLKYPLAYFASRQFVQNVLSQYPQCYRLALAIRNKIS